MKPLIRKYLSLGVLLLLSGGGLGAWGVRGIKRFFEGDSGDDGYSVTEVARGLVLPHVSTLAGIAAVTFGLILLIKGIIFLVRQAKDSR